MFRNFSKNADNKQLSKTEILYLQSVIFITILKLLKL
jgi:hypothetical protein